MKTTIELTPEKFSEIFTNEKFRNQVAFAHGCINKDGSRHRQSCSYPVTYIVTDKQIEAAKAEKERAKAEVLANNPETLIFTGMGSAYAERYEDDVCNHRIRTEVLNSEGKLYFVEFGTGQGTKIRVDHSIDRDLELSHEGHDQPYNNFGGIERAQGLGEYTKRNVLSLVNKTFNCKFTQILIDSYNLTTDDYTSKSPV